MTPGHRPLDDQVGAGGVSRPGLQETGTAMTRNTIGEDDWPIVLRPMGRTVDGDNLVSAVEIAERLNRSRNIVHSWLRRYPSFPRPIVMLAIGHLWRWPAVDGWARETGRSSASPAMSTVGPVRRKVEINDLVSVAKIGERLGRTRSVVYNWQRRRSDVPAPVAMLGIGLVWSLSEVQHWFSETERLQELKRHPAPPSAALRMFAHLVQFDTLRPGSERVPAGTDPVAWIVRSLRHSPETMPAALCALVELPVGSSYADGVTRWMADRNLRMPDLARRPPHWAHHHATNQARTARTVSPPAAGR